MLLGQLARVELAGGMGYEHPDASLTRPALYFYRLAATALPAFDALVAPMLGIVANPAAESFIGPLGVAYPQRVNLASVTTGMPTVSVPSGLGRGGLPTAVQLLGARLSENALLDAACALEARTGLAAQFPPAFIP